MAASGRLGVGSFVDDAEYFDGRKYAQLGSSRPATVRPQAPPFVGRHRGEAAKVRVAHWWGYCSIREGRGCTHAANGAPLLLSHDKQLYGDVVGRSE
jgi:hypothetical protein